MMSSLWPFSNTLLWFRNKAKRIWWWRGSFFDGAVFAFADQQPPSSLWKTRSVPFPWGTSNLTRHARIYPSDLETADWLRQICFNLLILLSWDRKKRNRRRADWAGSSRGRHQRTSLFSSSPAPQSNTHLLRAWDYQDKSLPKAGLYFKTIYNPQKKSRVKEDKNKGMSGGEDTGEHTHGIIWSFRLYGPFVLTSFPFILIASDFYISLTRLTCTVRGKHGRSSTIEMASLTSMRVNQNGSVSC